MNRELQTIGDQSLSRGAEAHVRFILDRFKEAPAAPAIIWKDTSYSYRWLSNRLEEWRRYLDQQHVAAGEVVSLEADFSPNAIALFLALVDRSAILVPLTRTLSPEKREQFYAIATVQKSLRIGDDETAELVEHDHNPSHEFLGHLRSIGHAGLIVFTSGSTGVNKAAVHDFVPLLEKFIPRRSALRTITFLLFDHLGGVNTMLYNLSNLGTIVTVANRHPDTILKAAERHRVELLPTSPTFLNLMIISEAYKRYDLSSLKKITYGTEPMPEQTLRRLREIFPSLDLQQTYGLSELGVMRSKSRSSDSLWMKIGGEGFATRVVDGLLEIKAKSAMLGYLNAPSPFTEDGWFKTGDRTETDGEYVRIIGRQSEIINVGGEKVYPMEVEGVIREVENVLDVTVYSKDHAFTGKVVCAVVNMREPGDEKQFVLKIKKHCMATLKPFQVPVQITVTDNQQFGERYKKLRADIGK